MRKALTLIELIFSMVIIGIVFTVIPKLIISMNQSAQVTIKEEAMFNAVAMMGAIINLPWDNNNTVNNQIINVTNGNPDYDCNISNTKGGALGYRKGGFVGGRDCSVLTNGTFDFNASFIGKEDAEYNDIDDFHDTNISADKNCSGVQKGLFKIGATVTYMDDPSSTGITDLNLSIKVANQSSNTKRIWIRVGYGIDHKLYDPANPNKCITSLEYHSFNLGNTKIKYQDWQ
ncbi:MAG: type II secretion system protein [Sulfurimonas sp.]|jgi:prepilin-type N-terminal cleavage/methylation domain-containing protein